MKKKKKAGQSLDANLGYLFGFIGAIKLTDNQNE